MSILGLTYVDGFLTASEQEAVLSEVNNQPWLNDLKRAVQHYGYKYDYRSRRIDESMKVGPLPDFALRISEKLMDCGLIETNPDQMIVNKYEPGQGIYPHIDCVPCFGDTIVTVSLGSKYTMNFTNIKTKEVKDFPLEVGSALVMENDARMIWSHGIKSKITEPWGRRGTRVSLTFRNVIL